MGNAVPSSISAERAIAGGIIAAQPERRTTVVRLPSPLADFTPTDIAFVVTGSIEQRAVPEINLPLHSAIEPSPVHAASW